MLARGWARLRRPNPLVAVVVLLVAAGGIVQFADHSAHPFTYFYLPEAPMGGRDFTEDAELFWAPPDHFRSIDELARRTPEENRLFFFGGSVVYGYHTDRSFPAVLQNRLKDDGRHAGLTVLNYSFPAYTSQQSRILARRVLSRFRGRLIFVSHGGNEVTHGAISDRQAYERNRLLETRVRYWLNQVKLYGLARRLLLRFRDEVTGPKSQREESGAVRISASEFRDDLLDFIRLAREYRMKLVFMSEENFVVANRLLEDPYFQAMADLAREHPEVAYLDVRAFLRRFARGEYPDHVYSTENDKNIFLDSCHLAPLGNKLVGGFLYDELLRRGLLD